MTTTIAPEPLEKVSGPGLVLASKSPARRMLLENAGLDFRSCDAGVDENHLKAKALREGLSPEALAINLAEAKATAAHSEGKGMDAYLGCDQILCQDGIIYDKPVDLIEAANHLRTFSGKTHRLISAVVIVQTGQPTWSHIEIAEMHVRPLSDAFIDDYQNNHGTGVLSSVGAYRLEGYGAHLFQKIEGDYFTVLGLPLLPLLEELRKRGILPH